MTDKAMTDKAMSGTDVLPNKNILSIMRYGRLWAVYDNRCKQQSVRKENVAKQNVEQLVCVTVYKKGAQEVVRRLEAAAPLIDEETTDGSCRGCTLAGNGHDE